METTTIIPLSSTLMSKNDDDKQNEKKNIQKLSITSVYEHIQQLATFVQRCIIIYNKNLSTSTFHGHWRSTVQHWFQYISALLLPVCHTHAFIFYYIHSICFQCLLLASGVHIPIVPTHPGIHIKENMFKAWNPLESLAAEVSSPGHHVKEQPAAAVALEQLRAVQMKVASSGRCI